MIEGISAVTLGTHEMPRAVRFYCALGFEVLRANEQSSFTSFRAGMSYLNLIAQPTERRWLILLPLLGLPGQPGHGEERPKTQLAARSFEGRVASAAASLSPMMRGSSASRATV